jgi:hypothetical protein
MKKSEKQKVDPDRERELTEFNRTCGNIEDPVLLILRVHLYIEYMLERIIVANLRRGDRIIEKGRLTFVQKLVLVSSFDRVDDVYITMIGHLNSVRNRCAHERQKEITLSDIEQIGRPIGPPFTKIRKEFHDNILNCLIMTVSRLCGGLGAITHSIELEKNS